MNALYTFLLACPLSLYFANLISSFTPGISNRAWLLRASKQSLNTLYSFQLHLLSQLLSEKSLTLYGLSVLKSPFFWLLTLTALLITLDPTTVRPVHLSFRFTLLVSSLSALCLLDWKYFILPDLLVFIVLWLGLLSAPSFFPITYSESIIAACGGYLSLAFLNEVFYYSTGNEGMGRGDMKLLAALGTWLGYDLLPYLLLLSSAMALLYFQCRIFFYYKRNRPRSLPSPNIPFGSFLSLSGMILVLYQFINPIH